jgi:hypothetical protein
MIRKFFILILIFTCAENAIAQRGKDRNKILAVLEQQRMDWNKGNLKAYMQGYWRSDSLLFVGKSGATYGWEQTLANYQRSYPDKQKMGELVFGIQKIEFLSRDKAFILGSWHLKRESDELKGYFTLIFKRFKNHWLIVVDHSS